MDLLPIPEVKLKRTPTGTTLTPHPDVTTDVSLDTNPTPKSLIADRLEALLQI